MIVLLTPSIAALFWLFNVWRVSGQNAKDIEALKKHKDEQHLEMKNRTEQVYRELCNRLDKLDDVKEKVIRLSEATHNMKDTAQQIMAEIRLLRRLKEHENGDKD